MNPFTYPETHLVTIAGSACLLCSAALHAAPLPLINPGFESGIDGDSSLTPIAGWTDSGTEPGFWLQDGSGGGSFPQDPSEPQDGLLYLSGNRLAGGAGAQPANSTLSQVVAIDPADLPLVQSDTAFIRLDFFYQDVDVNDAGSVSVDYLDASGEIIATATTGTLPNVAANGTAYDPVNAPWTPVTLLDPVPFDTESIRINIQTIRSGGSATNLHFDSFTAEITEEDSDGDGLPDTYEQTIIDADPDDAVTDLTHVAGPDDLPTITDFDNDGLSDADEYEELTDPLDPDSDDDGLADGVETLSGSYNGPTDTGTDPLDPDWDLDGFNDGLEVTYGSDPTDELSLPGDEVPVVNGGFESAPITTPLAGEPVSSGNFPGWSVATNEAWIADGFTTVSANDPGLAPEGFQFLTMNRQSPEPDALAAGFEGGDDAVMTVRQDVDVSALASEIDAGARTLLLALEAFENDPYDLGVMEIRFLDGSGTDLGRQSSFATLGNVDGWQSLVFPAYPPAGTRTVRLSLGAQNTTDLGVNSFGTVRNVAYDDVRLRILFMDSDSDGMADDWELANGLNPSDSGDAAGQNDADTLSNLEEFQAGTNPFEADTDGDGFDDDVELAAGSDPLDAASVPTDSPVVITAAGFNGEGEFELTLSGLDPSKTYRLLRGEDLLAFPTEVETKQPLAETDTYTDATPPPGRAFYILEEVAP